MSNPYVFKKYPLIQVFYFSEREINNLVRRADFNNDAYVQEFGLAISNSMMEVRGRVLPPPKLQYGGRVSSMSGQVSLLKGLAAFAFICFLDLSVVFSCGALWG